MLGARLGVQRLGRKTSSGNLQRGAGRMGSSGSGWDRGHGKTAWKDDRNQAAPPGPQPLLPGDLQPQHAEEIPAAPSCSKHPPLSSQDSNKPCSPGQLLSSQGSLARLFGRATWGEAKAAAWIRQQNIHALPPPPAPLPFPMGFEA